MKIQPVTPRYIFQGMMFIISVSFCIWLTECTSKLEDGCVIEENKSVTGIALIEDNLIRDGQINVLFFPVCNLDTATSIIKCLHESTKGFLFSANQKDITAALEKRKTKLTRVDTDFRSYLYATSVIVKIYDLDKDNKKPFRDESFTLNLKTKEIFFSKIIYPVYCKKSPKIVGF